MVSLIGHAAIPPQEVLDTRTIKPVYSLVKGLQPEHVAMVIPMNLQPGTNDEKTIMARVMDHSLNTFVQGDFFRATELGKAADTVEQAMKTEVTFGDGYDDNGEPSVIHKINMQFQALEQKAFVSYSGLTNLNLTLAAATGFDISMNQALDDSTTLVLTHQTRDALSAAKLMWAR
ncbi:MAG TPA: hypothetical protein VFV50_01155 [Bdellovibrionales bacterium]|nr:hypothetical protein [Bdellovibrionales bacterium]